MSSCEPTTPTSSTSTTASSSHSSRRHVGPTLAVDLVAAARRLLAFLLSLPPPPPLRLSRSIRRYVELWLPLIAGGDSGQPSDEPAMLLPPPDVQFVWLCHCFHHASYAAYCASRFGRLIDRPAILDAENEDYAADRCRDVWAGRYPSEPFDIDGDIDGGGDYGDGHELFEMVRKYIGIGRGLSAPFVSEGVYLVAASRRYAGFLELVRKVEAKECDRLVPRLDILLMWLAHQSFPSGYSKDMAAMAIGEDVARMVVGFGELATEEALERTRLAWEEAYDEPYETAGTEIDAAAAATVKEAFYWEAAPAAEDANRRYKGLQPRFLVEVYVSLKGELEGQHADKTFLRLRAQRRHRSLKLDRPASNASSKTWQKAWHLYCEFGTRGAAIEVRRRTAGCFKNSKSVKNAVFPWNELLHKTTLLMTKELDTRARATVSITPPIQAPYLLKCVPDRVTDDGGAMISDDILRARGYRPQEGRWLTRTVLDHGGKECFILRMRVGRGIWRRGAETPSAVKWDERSIEIREGSWSYITSSVGYAPEKVVGTATPKREDQQEKKVIWHLSTGDVLAIQWEDGICFDLQNERSEEAQASLQRGRRLSYQVKKVGSSENRNNEEEHYLTLVRTSPDHPAGRATALLNWKLLAVEFLPEEDAAFVLLLCMVIARTMTEIRREDVAGLLVRRRKREGQVGRRDWGSVMLPHCPSVDPHLQHWFCNATEVLASAEMAIGGAVAARYSPADGKDALYRQAIIPS